MQKMIDAPANPCGCNTQVVFSDSFFNTWTGSSVVFGDVFHIEDS